MSQETCAKLGPQLGCEGEATVHSAELWVDIKVAKCAQPDPFAMDRRIAEEVAPHQNLLQALATIQLPPLWPGQPGQQGLVLQQCTCNLHDFMA